MNIQFQGIYGIRSKQLDSHSRFHNTKEVLYHLRQAAASQKVALETDPEPMDAKEDLATFYPKGKDGKVEYDPNGYCTSRLAHLNKIPSDPAYGLNIADSYLGNDTVYAFTEADAKVFQEFKADLHKLWKQNNFYRHYVTLGTDEIIDSRLDRIHKTLGSVAAAGAQLLILLPRLGFDAVMNKIGNAKQEKYPQAAAAFMSKWQSFLDKLPKGSNLLEADQVLSAIAANKFNAETGTLAS